jgi:hypothetical protein
MSIDPSLAAPAPFDLGEVLRIRAPLGGDSSNRASLQLGTRVYLPADRIWAHLGVGQSVTAWVWCEDRHRRPRGEDDDWSAVQVVAHINVEREDDVPLPGAPLHPSASAPVTATDGEPLLIVGPQRDHAGPPVGVLAHRSPIAAHQAEAQRWNKVAVIWGAEDGPVTTWFLERASVAPLPPGGLILTAADVPPATADHTSPLGRRVRIAHPVRGGYLGRATPSVGMIGRLSGNPADWTRATAVGLIPVVIHGPDLGYQSQGSRFDDEIRYVLDPRILAPVAEPVPHLHKRPSPR